MKKRSKKVLMIGPSLNSRGGMATVERQLVTGLSCDGLELTFIPTYNDGNKLKKAIYAGAALCRFCVTLQSSDLVHVHMAAHASFWRKRLFIDFAYRSKVPVILHLHSGEFAKWFEDECNDEQRLVIRNTFRKCSAVIVLSEEWRDCLLDKDVCSGNKLYVMHNAVPVPAQPCSPCAHQDVLFLGRLDARKSPDVLLRASKKALALHPKAKLIFGGDGYPERYKALARELGIAERCEFLGWITGEEKESLFQRAGIYCLPSKNEGMPMSVLEAMAYGIPTIATPVGGVPQIIEDGVNGYLMPVDDEERLSELLCQLLDCQVLRESIGDAGRATISEHFNIERNTEELMRLYKGLMG